VVQSHLMTAHDAFARKMNPGRQTCGREIDPRDSQRSQSMGVGARSFVLDMFQIIRESIVTATRQS
jgi:hypothetical protein